MHLYNAWLPPPVAELAVKEKDAFAHVVSTVKSAWRPDDEDSVYATLKWIYILDNFIKAKSEIALEDVKALVEVGLKLFLQSQYNLYIQVRWGNLLVRLLKKYGKKLDLTIQWRPFYELLLQTHFSRHQSAEGLRLRQRHLETLTSLIRSCRWFFPSGSAAEIWLVFRPFMENLWHNSSLEGAGFVQLFLPTNVDNQDFFTNDWVMDILNLWVGMPNCQFWDFQWATMVARCIKYCTKIDWECFLPVLFTQYLNMFEVPVAKTNSSYPFSRDVPRNIIVLFCSNKLVTPAKDIAKSIVYLLKPWGSAQAYFENMVGLLEQYYHPSNGGRWTYSLECFLRYLVYFFQKRLAQEQRDREVGVSMVQHFLGSLEREAFVKEVLKIIERSQYSKNESLAGTAAAAASLLSYVEPSMVLPLIVSRFHIALDTMTATHQLKSAVTAVALSARALLLASGRAPHLESDSSDCISSPVDYSNVLTFSMYNTLLGMDANDPPKTLATMQLFGSIFSSLTKLVDKEYGSMVMLDINFSDWLDEFLCRLFSLLLHLEPNSHLNEGLHSSPSSGTFLVEDGPFYFCMLEILLGKLTKPLYHQALKKICKFVHNHVLPGAVAEIGLLCSATLYSDPEEAVVQLLQPMIASVISSLKESPSTGFSGSQRLAASLIPKVSLSPALEASVSYQLNVLSVAINYGGPNLLRYKDEMKEVISAAFDAPSWKVNEAGNHLLRSLIGSLVLYYPLDQYKCHLSYPGIEQLEEWISTKDEHSSEVLAGPKWHIPSNDEIAYANDLLDTHLRSALDDLHRICQSENHLDSGFEKEHLKVILLRIDASLQGARSCLPDFQPLWRNGKPENQNYIASFIAGAAGVSVGSTKMRQDTAETIDIACKYVLEQRADDSILLILLIRILDALGNYGSLEYEEWSNHKQAWRVDSAAIKEPPSNFITGYHAQGKRRPRWALIDRSYMHNTWRASQSGYHQFRLDGNICLPLHITLLMNNLLQLSMHNYDAVRLFAGKSLIKMLKRFPSLIKECMPTLTASLRDPGTPEHAALGACTILASRTVMRHIMKDWSSFASLILAILGSSHHESFKAQKSIAELFAVFNVQYAGVPRSTFTFSEASFEKSEYMDLITQIMSLSTDMHSTHWRYNLMANRTLLLLVLPLGGNFGLASKTRDEIAGHFLVNLKSQLPPVRVLSAAALVMLLRASPYKNRNSTSSSHSGCSDAIVGSSLESALNPIIQEEGFLNDMLNSLSHDHIFSDAHGTSGRGSHAMATFQSITDKSITGWFQAFYASWPRTRNWNALLNGDAFLSSFAKLFKRLIQECGFTVLQALRSPLEGLLIATEEQGKQCVASEVLAGILHSDVNCVLEAWDGWLRTVVRKVLLQSTVESSPEWAACVRFAVTGKGRDGKTIPLARQKILECLAEPLPSTVATNIVAKRFTLLCAALLEIFPSCMPVAEINFHKNLLLELFDCMDHSAAQVREAVGAILCIVCTNIRLSSSFGAESPDQTKSFDWNVLLAKRASLSAIKIQSSSQSAVFDRQQISSPDNNGKDSSEQQEHIKWMETALHFIISALRSGRASALMDVIIGLLYPVISLQEMSHKDLSSLARAAFELLKWQIFQAPHVSTAVTVLVSAANDTNWHTRTATLTFLQSFMYRHTFLLTSSEKQCLWDQVQQLLTDNQVEVRELAATVLAGLMRGGDSKLVETFRESSYSKALSLEKGSKTRLSKSSHSLAATHGVVLALAASILSVPYDMPSWLPSSVTLLARFIEEPSPIKSTVMKAIAEFRRTHADTWAIQKDSFTEEQLEVLADMSSSSSYFA